MNSEEQNLNVTSSSISDAQTEPPVTIDSYDPHISKEQWKQYLEEIELPNHKGCIKLLKGMIELGGEASPKKLSEVYGGSPYSYNASAINIGKRAKKFFGIQPPTYDGSESLASIPFTGRVVNENGASYYSFIIRDELLAALKEVNMDNIDPYASKVWLLTWTPETWPWNQYAQICEDTKAGKPSVDSWECSSFGPQVGDEVFLLKLGNLPRGIIAHGKVSRPIYDKEYAESPKAAEGKKTKCIDVIWDRVLNYEKERIISQEDLNINCAGQYWGSQNSGIEISKEVLPALHKLWETVVDDDNEWWPSLLEYDPGLTTEQYLEVFKNERVITPEFRQALYELYMMPDHLGTFEQLAEQYGYDPAHYMNCLTAAAESTAKATGCRIMDNQQGARFWPVLFQGRNEKNDETENCWRMREAVQEAMDRLIDEDYFEEKTLSPLFDRNMILYGPPGTGKTYNAVIYAVAICDGQSVEKLKMEPYSTILARYRELKRQGRIAFTTFHQSYGYEEFIEGIKPKMQESSDAIGYTIADGVFKAFCREAGKAKRRSQPYVFIIDEINRGNISKIFGELITLIEETKRSGADEAMEAMLPYSKEAFSVPLNVYLLGTMNTADRSIALLDTALRRRFEFVELMPDSKVLESLGIGKIEIKDEQLNVAKMLDVINRRIEFLYDREHTIGHAFFTKLMNNPSIEVLADIFEKNIIPLLQEYFYEDYEKIQLVLGDNGKEDEYKFILDCSEKVKDIFNGNPDLDQPEKGYRIQKEAFLRLESYKQIGKDL